MVFGGGATGGLVAFLGPSLASEEARRIVPDVVLLPPVCQGDLTSAVRNLSPRAVLVVDGEFSQALSVWHKEVLHALELGVPALEGQKIAAAPAAAAARVPASATPPTTPATILSVSPPAAISSSCLGVSSRP